MRAWRPRLAAATVIHSRAPSSRLAVRDDLVLGRLVVVEVEGPPLTRQLTAVWRHDLDPLPPEGARLLAVARGAAR